MINASSLVYAIFICLLVSLMTGGLIYWATLSNNLSTKNEIREGLISHCNSCFNYALTSPQAPNGTIDLFNDGFKCIIDKKQWGLLTIIRTKALLNKDSISTAYFTGNKAIKNDIALYVSDLSEKLTLSGITKIQGDVKLPKKGFEITNILGNQQINNPKINGRISTSNKTLPQINLNTALPTKSISKTLDELNREQITFNDFSNKTIRIQLSGYETLSNITLKGNFILDSPGGTITIDNNANIEDVIINAKSVIINNGFKGSLQIFASEEVNIKSNVVLDYPSSIVISDKIENEKTIIIDSNSKVLGGILINTEGIIEIKNNNLSIAKESLIIGDVYCNGIMKLKGDVIGSVYTNKFEYNTEYSSYSNLLLNTTIDNLSLPENFIHLPYFKESTNITFGTIKKIQ